VWYISVAILVSLGIAPAQTGHDYIPDDATFLPTDHPAIRYSEAPLNDPVTRLNMKLANGSAKLEYDPDGLGYLPSLLKLLGVNPDSQMLVFSKTSFQAPKISPRNPRALYFSDDVQIGYVRGGEVFEIVGLDPKQGDVFYTLDMAKSDKPSFDRRDGCFQCHLGPVTQGVPGIMVATVHADPSGAPAFQLGEPVVDHRTPFEERWGGWYVSGTHGNQKHQGNAVFHDPGDPEHLDTEGTQNLTSLAGRFDPRGYLSTVSDIVALMTLEHQTRMTNLLIRVGWETRIAQHDGKMDDPETRARIDADIESTITYMLFADEAPLHEPVQGVSTFTKTFPQRGPRDHQGRSLRDFDLQKRLFRYPLSYMLYSAAFDGLPEIARDRIYKRLYEVLNGNDQDKKFAALTRADRQAILEIVRDTKTNLPAFWRKATPE